MTAGQLAAWKAALAAHHKQRRQQRGRNAKRYRVAPGMVRRPPADGDAMMTAPDGHGARGEPGTPRGVGS